jgi:hypothetical protein
MAIDYSAVHSSAAVCSRANTYFDEFDLHCHDCQEATTQAAIVSCCAAFVLILLGAWLALVSYNKREKPSTFGPLRKLLRVVEKLSLIWRLGGGRFKVKVLVGLSQCLAAIPTVYNVKPPNSLDEYTRWIRLMELPNQLGVNLFIPQRCLGSYRRQLLFTCFWPICFVLGTLICRVSWVLAKDHIGAQPIMEGSRGNAAAVRAGLVTERLLQSQVVRRGVLETLPTLMVVTFLVVPTTSTRIFVRCRDSNRDCWMHIL